MPDKLIITGCDEKTEWQLWWFIENYYKHNTIPLAIADFGMSEEAKNSLKSSYHPALFCHIDCKVKEGINAVVILSLNALN